MMHPKVLTLEKGKCFVIADAAIIWSKLVIIHRLDSLTPDTGVTLDTSGNNFHNMKL